MPLRPAFFKARSNLKPKYRFQRCERVKGMCKTFCDDDEYDYGYCIKWRNQCCI
ncbi:beta-defensin 110-like [Neomonachus schauinslandi]|uniref:Beta-defensin n=1 Tax=Neomonachus schauinslandi TaxID=29088 RepID=A0A2Y9H7G4_NEOSC|nr:beta-defensin 110-like [Neomonachus schauinslandi]